MEYKVTKRKIEDIPNIKDGFDYQYSKEKMADYIATILKQRDEAVNCLKNVLKLRDLIEYPDDVEEKHSMEALAIFGMLNNIESVIKSITESK